MSIGLLLTLGLGFGLVVPALNTITAAFHPGGVDKSILALNALLGPGTALAPVFVAFFVGLERGGACRSCRPSCWRFTLL